jgi:hypothetical protein
VRRCAPSEEVGSLARELLTEEIPSTRAQISLADAVEHAHVDTRAHAGSAWAAVRVFAASRLVVVACALVSTMFVNARPGKGPWPALHGPHIAVLQALGRWDAAWYLDIAHFGYRPIAHGATLHSSEAFFPGYPLLVRVLSVVTGTPELLAAVLATTIFGAVAAPVMWKIVEEISGTDAARRAVTLFCFSPGAFVLSMAYSEALFIAAAAGALWLMLRRRWVTAGLCVCLASFTRPNSMALVGTCAVVALVEIVKRRNWTALATPAIGSIGIAAYFAYLFVRSGNPFEWFYVERVGWADRVAPVAGIVKNVSALPRMSVRNAGLNDLACIVTLGVAIALVVLLLRWRPPLPIALYGITAAAFAASSYHVGLRPRMLLAAFPLVLAAGVELRGRVYRAVLATSVILLITLSLFTFGTLATFP